MRKDAIFISFTSVLSKSFAQISPLILGQGFKPHAVIFLKSHLTVVHLETWKCEWESTLLFCTL